MFWISSIIGSLSKGCFYICYLIVRGRRLFNFVVSLLQFWQCTLQI